MNIQEIVERISHLMYGHNYEVCLGIDVFEGKDNDAFNNQLKNKYPSSRPDKSPLIELTSQEFYEDIRDKFDFRGDSGAGLNLSPEKEVKLKELQQQYFDYLNQFINNNSKFYDYSFDEGIPGYPVFWEFRYVVFTEANKILFVYGSSSD